MRGLIAIGVAVMALIGIATLCTPSPRDRPERAPISAPSAPPPAAPMPSAEEAFCETVHAYSARYAGAAKAGANELALSTIRTERASALRNLLPTREITRWTGVIKSMATNTEGDAAIEVVTPCGITMKTWNNSLSDFRSHTIIQQGTPLYRALLPMRIGQAIEFSGELVGDDKRHLLEASVTESGSMAEPEFITRFSSVAAR